MGYWALTTNSVLAPLVVRQDVGAVLVIAIAVLLPLAAKTLTTFLSSKKDRRLEVRLDDGRTFRLKVEHPSADDLRTLLDGLKQLDQRDRDDEPRNKGST